MLRLWEVAAMMQMVEVPRSRKLCGSLGQASAKTIATVTMLWPGHGEIWSTLLLKRKVLLETDIHPMLQSVLVSSTAADCRASDSGEKAYDIAGWVNERFGRAHKRSPGLPASLPTASSSTLPSSNVSYQAKTWRRRRLARCLCSRDDMRCYLCFFFGDVEAGTNEKMSRTLRAGKFFQGKLEVPCHPNSRALPFDIEIRLHAA